MADVAAAFSGENMVHETLGIRAVEATPGRVIFEMDVDARVHQFTGILHGGVSAVLAESAASIGAWLNCDQNSEAVVGTDLNISHLRAQTDGSVRSVATPIRIGRSVQVWGIDIVDQDGKLVAVARLTVAVRQI
jgi:uncharacterized protein (TIGR00369 family)